MTPPIKLILNDTACLKHMQTACDYIITVKSAVVVLWLMKKQMLWLYKAVSELYTHAWIWSRSAGHEGYVCHGQHTPLLTAYI